MRSGIWRVLCLGLVAALFGTGCGPSSSGVRLDGRSVDAYEGPVSVTVITEPAGRSIGVVEVSGTESLRDLVSALRDRAAEIGGTDVVVDSYSTTFEQRQRTRTESYSCGTTSQPRTCTRTVTYSELVAVGRMVGRAFDRRSPQ